jgi:hypothetical protein
VEHFDDLRGIDWAWLSMDGAMTKAPLGGAHWSQSDRSRQVRGEAQSADRGPRRAAGIGGGWRQPA